MSKTMSIVDTVLPNPLEVSVYARAHLPTEHGDFTLVAFQTEAGPIEDVALVRGELLSAEAVPTRLHSECVTGDVFHSLRCDCRAQLEMAQRHFASLPSAVLLYMRQEGRGIGLGNKVAAYALQEVGLDTVEANLHLGFDDDLRAYDLAAGMLAALGLSSITLFTNNPHKIEGLKAAGVKVKGREPLIIRPNRHNEHYLRTKEAKSGHLLEFEGK